MLRKVPHEIIASLFAASTAFIGGNALHLPPWAIFIGWAGTYLAGGPHLAVMKRLWAAMPAGSSFALIIVLLDRQWGNAFGSSTLATDAVLAIFILVVNTALMYTGRIKMFSLIPGMFLGFASYFATFYGGFGFATDSPWAAWISVIAMNALGVAFAWLVERLSPPSPAEAVSESSAGQSARRS